jgi:hypothetical protein
LGFSLAVFLVRSLTNMLLLTMVPVSIVRIDILLAAIVYFVSVLLYKRVVEILGPELVTVKARTPTAEFTGNEQLDPTATPSSDTGATFTVGWGRRSFSWLWWLQMFL